MINIIEKIFEEKCRNTECEVFFSQWLISKEYVPKVLSLIIRTFPHYSLHDITHSENILNNIVRVLGADSLFTLGPVDLWLLLASAYYHDIGMALFAKDIIDSFKNEDFIQFVVECQDDPNSPLNKYASLFEIKDDGLHYKPVAIDGDTIDSYTFLLAEYVRKEHSQRSKESINTDKSLHLAGNPIPERLLRLLGKICEVHTLSFEKVMQLPYCEAGLGMDDCHPRFIACLLRIGDLLDLDNNRYSSVLLKTLPSVPKDSLLHKEKHFAIDHIRLDSTSIEITARCDNYEVADISNRWLEMISEEFRNQRESWTKIVPDSFIKNLPFIGELKVELLDYDTIDGKKRPVFEIDDNRAIEMLQGSGLYSEPYQCIRELLQNAVDATYLSIFKEQGILSIDDFFSECKKKDITITISKKAVDDEKVTWHVEIDDNGIGMSKDDLLYLTKTGSKNPKKMQMINKMPEYMKPSGTFGIGFQSVFLLTDKVELLSKKIDASEAIFAELYNPAGPRRGTVLLKSGLEKERYGTHLSFDFYSNKDLNHWSVRSRDYYTFQAIESYDFICNSTLDLEVAKIIDEVNRFNYACPLNIVAIIDNSSIKLEKTLIDSFDYYSENYKIQIKFGSNDAEIYYRNQIIDNPHINIKYFRGKINILGANAKDILSLNRNEIISQAQDQVYKDIVCAINEAVLKCSIKIPKDQLPRMSMFVNESAEDISKYPKEFIDSWNNYVCDDVLLLSSPQKQQVKLSDIVSKCQSKPVIIISPSYRSYSFAVKETDKALFINVVYGDELVFLRNQVYITHKYPTNNIINYLNEDDYSYGYLLSMTPVDPIGNFDDWTYKYLDSSHFARSLMPLNNEFKSLRIKDGIHFNFSKDFSFSVSGYPQMICPYVRCPNENSRYDAKMLKWNDCNGDLYRITYDNRYDESVTIDDIIETYSRFRKKMEPHISKVNNRNRVD